MPIYEYSCTKCGKTVEAMQKMSDPPLKKCPHCGGALAKMISSTSFVLKGTGWYATDYAKKGNGSGGSSGNGKRTDLKDHMKDADAKKDVPPAEKAAEKTSDVGPEKTSNTGADKPTKSGTED